MTTKKAPRTTAIDYHDWAGGDLTRRAPSLICTACGKVLGKRTKASEWKAVFYSPCPGYQRMTPR